MTVETRYFTRNSVTVNDLSCYELRLTQTGTALSISINSYSGSVSVTQYLGIRVYKRTSAGVETEITSGVSAIASGDASGIISATWACPSTALNSTDSIVVRVYGDSFTPPTTLRGTWTTQQLNALSLDAATWTVYYYLRRVYDLKYDETYYYFSLDTATYNSRIENFTWTPVVVVVVAPKMVGDGLTWIVA